MFNDDLDNVGDPLVLMKVVKEEVNLLDKYRPLEQRIAFQPLGRITHDL